MALRTLDLCTKLWGRAHVLDGLPRIRSVENAVYLPWSHGGPWGVFDEHGNPIRESLNLRTIEGLASGPQPSYVKDIPKSIGLIDDTFLYLGLLNVHFGHFLINSFSRLWPLAHGRQRLPRLVWHTIGRPSDHSGFEFLTSILTGLGTHLDEIATFQEPVRFRRLLVPETSFHEQFCAYPVFRTIAARVGSAYYKPNEVDTVDTPIYLSKTHLKRGVGRFDDEQVIEDILRSSGIDIAYPEELTFPDQVRLFARRKCIIATSGSALHTSVFGPPRRRILSINPIREVNSNFALIDRLNRNDIEYYCPKDMTYGKSPQFMTTQHAPDPRGIAEDILEILSRKRGVLLPASAGPRL